MEKREDVREIFSTLYKCKNANIITGKMRVDHLHLCVAIPRELSTSNFMGYLKEKMH